ncbi:MAG TPA: PEGA domain-containing protein [Planctomycetota bacterium]
MRRTVSAIFCAVLACSLLRGGEVNEADSCYKLGLTKLRDAQNDHSALIPATALLAKAAMLYEAAGDESKTAEVNSCLYWAKKRMTLADTEAIKASTDIAKRVDDAAKVLPGDQAQSMLAKAEEFAKTHADDALLLAVRYFEVADRFKDSDAGRKAMELSLAALQKLGERANLEVYKPAPTDGKAFIKSEPAGAAIIFVSAEGGKFDTGKITPSVVQLPVGRQVLELALKLYKRASVSIEIDGKTIAKPEAVKLETLTTPIDILFEDGWQVFVDGKPAKGAGGAKAETPCTVELPLGAHEVGLAKDGFWDVKQRVNVVEGGLSSAGRLPANSLSLQSQPSKGTSALLRAKADPASWRNKIVVWNSHNANWANAGTRKFSLTLFSGEKTVFTKADVAMDWSQQQDYPVTIPVDDTLKFDRVRVVVTSWAGRHPSLSEIEVFADGRNVALGKAVKSSGAHNNAEHRDSWKRINDGITNSNRQGTGYWLAPPDGEAWIEIDLSKSAGN